MRAIDLTNGSIPSSLVRLAAPILLGMIMFTLYLLADLYFVGRLGPDAVAALSISGNAFFIHLGLSTVLGTGAMALIAQSFGRKDYSYAATVFKQSIMLTLMVMVQANLLNIALDPLLIFGLLGFPPFALELFAFYQLLRKVCRGDKVFGSPSGMIT